MPRPKDYQRWCTLFADAMADGPWESEAMIAHLRPALAEDPRQRWCRPLIRRVFRKTGSDRRPWPRTIRDWLMADDLLWRAYRRRSLPFAASALTPCMWATPGLPALNVPELLAPKELACWLGGAPLSQLRWYADRWAEHDRRQSTVQRPYRQQIRPKRSGGVRFIETPCAILKCWQRAIAKAILVHVPIHPAAHGFVVDRSIVTNARCHAGAELLLRLDIEDFFASIDGRRVAHFFRALGYPHAVATYLAGLVTTTLPEDVWQSAALDPHSHWQRRLRYRRPHLPQGAPSSPALANGICFRLDSRLHGLARRFGLTYTRYADDLALSGPRSSPMHDVRVFATAICEAEGFRINQRKVRLRSQAAQQRLTGLVINDGPNIDRRSYDRLKARLHRLGLQDLSGLPAADAAALRAELLGHIAHVQQVRPQRAERLRRLSEAITWPD